MLLLLHEHNAFIDNMIAIMNLQTTPVNVQALTFSSYFDILLSPIATPPRRGKGMLRHVRAHSPLVPCIGCQIERALASGRHSIIRGVFDRRVLPPDPRPAIRCS